MSLDVNKIIMESISEVTDVEPEVDQEEMYQDPTLEGEDAELYEMPIETLSAAIPPAISAGLGALTLRNRLRSVQQ